MNRKNMGDMAKLVVELLVSNFARSLKFYTEVLGFNTFMTGRKRPLPI